MMLNTFVYGIYQFSFPRPPSNGGQDSVTIPVTSGRDSQAKLYLYPQGGAQRRMTLTATGLTEERVDQLRDFIDTVGWGHSSFTWYDYTGTPHTCRFTPGGRLSTIKVNALLFTASFVLEVQ